MFAVLSPAKALDLSPPPSALAADLAKALESTEPSLPVFMEETASLMRTTRGLTQKKIRELMHISADLAKLNHTRYHSFELPLTTGNAHRAAFAFNGEVYRGLAARELSVPQLQWAQTRVGILSGLFGLLRPLDLIQPYRLEMGTALKTRRGKSLYAFWGSRLANRIDDVVKGHNDTALVNLASNEYFKAVDRKALKTQVVTCIFEDYKADANEGKVISFLAKQARGRMARFIIEQRVDVREGLKDFAVERYRFDKKRSTDVRYIFKRKFIPVSAQ